MRAQKLLTYTAASLGMAGFKSDISTPVSILIGVVDRIVWGKLHSRMCIYSTSCKRYDYDDDDASLMLVTLVNGR